MRGLDQPIIPIDEYVPRPPTITSRSAEWGVAVRTYLGEIYQADSVAPQDIVINGAPVSWHHETNGSGVAFGRATDPFGMTIALLRAVPLS